VQILGRLAKTAAIAGALLALGLMILIPEARAFTGSWTTSQGDALAQMSELSERSVVLRRDGSTLAYLHADENREPIKLSQVPDSVINAVIGVEDDRYWKHHGIDLRGMFRALATNVQSGEVRQGGSTLTQQLVKNSLLTPEKTVDRKVREALLAWRLEDHNTKKQILERYLNTVYFGNGAYGVQAAAEVYFGKKAAQLDEGDAVLLAGLIRNPVGYDPIKFPDAAKARRRVVVQRLVSAHVISQAAGDRALARALPRNVTSLEKTPNDYFVEEVKQSLLHDHRLGETEAERYNAVFKGGLRIYTTLDPDVAQAAQDAVDQILPDTQGRFTAAVASVEPATGAVRAIVGGKDFDAFKFNLATQSHRQPGSAFKAFDLVAALREGYGPATMVDGTSPCTVKFPDNLPYELENSEGEGGGVMPLTAATAGSINCAYVRLASVVGLDEIEQAAHDLGIKSDLHAHNPKTGAPFLPPAMAIGGLETGVSPLEMASAYATIAADGVYHKPYYVEKVLDRHGKVLFRGATKGEQRVSTQVARQAVSILRGVVTNGTGTRANPGKWPTFGKTGTTSDFTDAWFVGSTKQLTAAVWMGSPVGAVSMTRVGSVGRVFGGTYPARIFGQLMRTAMSGRPAIAFTPPDPKQIGNRQMHLSPSATTGVPVTEVQVGEPGVTIVDGTGPGDGYTPGTRPPRHTTTTEDNSPPPTEACQEPPDWDPDQMGGPFCRQ
jgi:membrane peptidoglycan carboxypeptidase